MMLILICLVAAMLMKIFRKEKCFHIYYLEQLNNIKIKTTALLSVTSYKMTQLLRHHSSWSTLLQDYTPPPSEHKPKAAPPPVGGSKVNELRGKIGSEIKVGPPPKQQHGESRTETTRGLAIYSRIHRCHIARDIA